MKYLRIRNMNLKKSNSGKRDRVNSKLKPAKAHKN